jgi:ribosomal protein S18 acetylase RimI-like enzyme
VLPSSRAGESRRLPYANSRFRTMADFKPRPPGQTLLELNVADVDLDAFRSLFQRLTAAGITFTTLRERQTVDSRWLEQFTFLDNQTRSTSGNPEVPRSVAAMRSRITKLALDPAACFVARDVERWIGYTVLDTTHSSQMRLHQGWTGVLPACQRRGIGTALKVLGVGYARQNGYAFIETTLRTSNVASQALSRRVGFRPRAG